MKVRQKAGHNTRAQRRWIMKAGLKEVSDGGSRRERSERSDSPSGGAVEIPAIARRRQFTTEYKLRILAEVDECSEPGQCAAIARREGIYSSTISKWKEWRDRMQHQDDQQTGTRPASDQNTTRNQLRKLQRENERLKLRLKKTEGLIELQKKAFELLGDLNQDDRNNVNNS